MQREPEMGRNALRRRTIDFVPVFQQKSSLRRTGDGLSGPEVASSCTQSN